MQALALAAGVIAVLVLSGYIQYRQSKKHDGRFQEFRSPKELTGDLVYAIKYFIKGIVKLPMAIIKLSKIGLLVIVIGIIVGLVIWGAISLLSGLASMGYFGIIIVLLLIIIIKMK